MGEATEKGCESGSPLEAEEEWVKACLGMRVRNEPEKGREGRGFSPEAEEHHFHEGHLVLLVVVLFVALVRQAGRRATGQRKTKTV